MKKIRTLPALLFVVLVSFSACTLTSSEPQVPTFVPDNACNELTVVCELQKNVIVYTPIDVDPEMVDVYNHPIVANKNQWYEYDVKSRTSIPVCFNFPGQADQVWSGTMNRISPAMLQNRWQNLIEVDTTNLITGKIPGVYTACIILSGKNRMTYETQGELVVAKISYAY